MCFGTLPSFLRELPSQSNYSLRLGALEKLLGVLADVDRYVCGCLREDGGARVNTYGERVRVLGCWGGVGLGRVVGYMGSWRGREGDEQWMFVYTDIYTCV